MNIILLRRLRWLVLAFMFCMLTVLLFGCFVPGGGYGYDDGGGIGGAYYEPFGFDYGGWGPDYQVAPYRGGDHRPANGGGHAARAYRSAPASHSMPSIPSHSRSGGSRSRR
jgi:hypothetical protein